MEPEVEGATAGMTEPVPEVAADERGENRRTRCGRLDAIRARSPRRSRAGDISRPHRDELNGMRDDGTRTINYGIKLFDLRILVNL